MQFELFPIAEYSPVTQETTLNHWEPTAVSTRTKRPKGKAIAPLPKTAIALPTPNQVINLGT